MRTAVAGILKLPERRVRVIAPDVGGGFGQKCVVAREEALVLLAARAVGAPVKWTEDRQENLLAGFQGHDQRYDVRAAFDEDGRLLALDADILCDVGAYSNHPFTGGVEPLMAATELLGRLPRQALPRTGAGRRHQQGADGALPRGRRGPRSSSSSSGCSRRPPASSTSIRSRSAAAT